MDNDDFKIIYIIDKVPNFPMGKQLPYHSNNNLFTVKTSGYEPIMATSSLEEKKFTNKLNSNKDSRSVYEK